MSFYPRMAATAHRLITKFGKSAILIDPNVAGDGQDYDPETGGVPNDPAINYPCTAVVLPIEDRDIDGTVVKIGDKRAYISTLPNIPEPIPEWRFSWESIEYNVIKIMNISPAGLNVLYDVVIRK